MQPFGCLVNGKVGAAPGRGQTGTGTGKGAALCGPGRAGRRSTGGPRRLQPRAEPDEHTPRQPTRTEPPHVPAGDFTSPCFTISTFHLFCRTSLFQTANQSSCSSERWWSGKQITWLCTRCERWARCDLEQGVGPRRPGCGRAVLAAGRGRRACVQALPRGQLVERIAPFSASTPPPPTPPTPPCCSHMHTNPFQIQDLAAANLLPGCSYTSWFEVRASGGPGQGAPLLLQAGDCQGTRVLCPHTLCRCQVCTVAERAAPCAWAVQAGDYHDTLMLPQMQLWGTVRLRLQPGEFTGESWGPGGGGREGSRSPGAAGRGARGSAAGSRQRQVGLSWRRPRRRLARADASCRHLCPPFPSRLCCDALPQPAARGCWLHEGAEVQLPRQGRPAAQGLPGLQIPRAWHGGAAVSGAPVCRPRQRR